VFVDVSSANGDRTLPRSTYRISVKRDACPPDTPFFSRAVGVCSAACPPGSFGDLASQRCAQCPADCLLCHGWDACLRCLEDDYTQLRILRLRVGRCTQLEIPWKPVAAGAVAFLLFGLCVGCLVTTPGSTRQKVPTEDPDFNDYSMSMSRPMSKKEFY
jgi:hypothetical protein